MHFWGLIPPTGCPGKWFRASCPYFELLRPFRLEIRSISRFFLIFGLFFDPPKNPYSLEISKNDPFSSFWGLFLSDPVRTPQIPPGHTIFMKKYSYLPEKAPLAQKKKKKKTIGMQTLQIYKIEYWNANGSIFKFEIVFGAKNPRYAHMGKSPFCTVSRSFL